MSSDELEEYLEEESAFKRIVSSIHRIAAGGFPAFSVSQKREDSLQFQKRLSFLDFKIRLLLEVEPKGARGLGKEIRRQRIDMKLLKNESISLLIIVENQVRERYSVAQSTLNAYRISVKSEDRRLPEWDHLNPDPNAVMSSLELVKTLEEEVEEAGAIRRAGLQSALGRLRRLGVPVPAELRDYATFSEIKSAVNRTLNSIELSRAIALTGRMSEFYSYVVGLSSLFEEPLEVKLQETSEFITLSPQVGDSLDKTSGQEKETEREQKTAKNTSRVSVESLARLADAAKSASEQVQLNVSIDEGLDHLEDMVFVTCVIRICLEGAAQVLYELSRNDCVASMTDYLQICQTLVEKLAPEILGQEGYATMEGNFEDVTKTLKSLGLESLDCFNGVPRRTTSRPKEEAPPLGVVSKGRTDGVQYPPTRPTKGKTDTPNMPNVSRDKGQTTVEKSATMVANRQPVGVPQPRAQGPGPLSEIPLSTSIGIATVLSGLFGVTGIWGLGQIYARELKWGIALAATGMLLALVFGYGVFSSNIGLSYIALIIGFLIWLGQTSDARSMVRKTTSLPYHRFGASKKEDTEKPFFTEERRRWAAVLILLSLLLPWGVYFRNGSYELAWLQFSYISTHYGTFTVGLTQFDSVVAFLSVMSLFLAISGMIVLLRGRASNMAGALVAASAFLFLFGNAAYAYSQGVGLLNLLPVPLGILLALGSVSFNMYIV